MTELSTLASTAANQLKTDICRIHLLWEVGERSEAEKLFDDSLDRADRPAECFTASSLN